MTSHVAVSTPDFVVAFSDSQGTSAADDSEAHGGQKLFFGPDFIVAKAGASQISNPLFARLARAVVGGSVDAGSLHAFIQGYLASEVRQHQWGAVQFLTATECTEGRWLQEFNPSVFVNFGDRRNFAAIGSGSVFVGRTLERLGSLLCPWSQLTLAGTFCVTKRLADAANESLTVDDTHLAGIIVDRKCYAMGDKRIRPDYLEDPIRNHWPAVGTRFAKITAIAETTNAIVDQAFSSIHGVWSGDVELQAAADAINAGTQVKASYDLLESELTQYFAWYDGLLGR